MWDAGHSKSSIIQSLYMLVTEYLHFPSAFQRTCIPSKQGLIFFSSHQQGYNNGEWSDGTSLSRVQALRMVII